MIQAAIPASEDSMPIRWKMILPIVICAVAVLALSNWRTAAAAPQATAAPSRQESQSSLATDLSIPATTTAINSSTPLSQRVVHYDIDAKYDAAKHTIDATEVLTYHNLTGQALDHFPFHLYQNAFQPNATWVREAKLAGTRDTTYDHWEA